MKIKIKSITNIWKCSSLYIFIVLFSQLLGIFIPVCITKVFVLYLLMMTMLGMAKINISFNWDILIFSLCGFFFCITYYLFLREVFSYVYPAVIVMLFAYLYLCNYNTIRKSINIKVINRCILIYAIINVLLYLIRYSPSFQNNGIQLQFKGALPHTNMFGTIALSLFVTIFWINSTTAMINRFLLTYLIFVSMSRTYILCVLAVWLIWLGTFILKKINFWLKAFAGTLLLLVIGTTIFNIMVSIIPSMVRFKTTLFGENGRQYLEISYRSVIHSSTIIDKFVALGMAQKYLAGIEIEFSHSFTENSYAGVFLMLGIWGGVLLGIILIKMMRQVKNGQAFLVMIIYLASLMIQDTLLSVQTGILFFFSLAMMLNCCTMNQGENLKNGYNTF